jgi:hypothetical protein
MPTVSLKAHYDGEHIVLDERYDLPFNAALIVTLLPPAAGSGSEEWRYAAATGLARAYSDDEPEYSLADVKP